jgi:hypothetical protein
MRYTILLNKNEKTKEIEAQEQSRFVKSIFEALEIPVEFNPDEPYSIDDRLRLRSSLNSYNINIIGDIDGGLKIFVKTDLIAEWKKPHYVLKIDGSQIDPNKKLYLEMHINFWSVFESEVDK